MGQNVVTYGTNRKTVKDIEVYLVVIEDGDTMHTERVEKG